WLPERFEENRTHLRAVAYRMLGSVAEADDAVQEAWLRLSRSGTDGVQNVGGWLTTVVARVCLDMLRSRRSRREESLDGHGAEPTAGPEDGVDPEHEALLAVLEPDVVRRADRTAVHMGASERVRGAAAVAETFSGRARAARPALVNGAPGLVWTEGGRPRVVFGFTIARGKIVEIELVADPERLGLFDLAVL